MTESEVKEFVSWDLKRTHKNEKLKILEQSAGVDLGKITKKKRKKFGRILMQIEQADKDWFCIY